MLRAAILWAAVSWPASVALAGGGGRCPLAALPDRNAPSTSCTGCHSEAGGQRRGDGGHPVDVAYAPYVTSRRLEPDPVRAGVNVVLPGGKITCLTCHDPRSTLPNHLAAPQGGPVARRLCAACHRFQ